MKSQKWKKWTLFFSALSLLAISAPTGLLASGTIDDPNEGPARGEGNMDVPTETMEKAKATPKPSPSPAPTTEKKE